MVAKHPIPVLERFDHLSNDELQVRLEKEELALSNLSAGDQSFLLQELRVYQIELEMQNRQLRHAQVQLEISRDNFANLYDFAPVPFVTLSREGFIKEINLSGARWLANQEPEELIGHPFTMLLDDDTRLRFFRYLKRVFSTNRKLEEEFILKRENEASISARFYAVQRDDINNQEKVCYIAILDLTKQRLAEKEAEESREALSHSTRLAKLGEMASALAHEVSQPITAMINYSHILQLKLADHPDAGELKELAEKITTQANRSGDLLHRIRDFARRKNILKSHYTINEIIRESAELMHAKLSDNKVIAEIMVPKDTPTVFVDSQQIIQVMVNLISNAIDSIETKRCPGHISINVNQQKSKLLISVKDNGSGVSSGIRKNLFMPFVTGKEEGLGVGLSLCRSIIESNGGQIWLDPDYQDGANILFTLPIEE